MIANKIFSIKKDKNIILYRMLIDSDKIGRLLDALDSRYGRTETEIVDATFDGIIPISFGKYDSMSKICTVKNLGVYDTKKDRASEDYYKSLASSSREWDFLSDEEKLSFMPIEGIRTAKVKLEVNYYPVICKLIEKTFVTDTKPVIDCTDLIKYFNHVLGRYNVLKFDKMIDLNRNDLSWDDMRKSFLSFDDYRNFLNNASRYINIDDVEVTPYERKGVRDNINAISNELRRCITIEQIGMFPIDIEMSEDLEILKRFAIRNEDFTYLNQALEYAPVNYDGGQVIGNMHKAIIESYDLDGKETEKAIISRIEENKDIVSRITTVNNLDKIDALIKTIKAA